MLLVLSSPLSGVAEIDAATLDMSVVELQYIANGTMSSVETEDYVGKIAKRVAVHRISSGNSEALSDYKN